VLDKGVKMVVELLEDKWRSGERHSRHWFLTDCVAP
jgi:hypothetical protein